MIITKATSLNTHASDMSLAVSRSLSSAWCRELLYCDPSTDCKVTSRQLIS